ncbi:MAG: tetraacyldisaccharide 4'-kinase [Halieaceae bacterium]|jgi:tetraacyldisaccharide 4'-kinase|nr:tetraacyldisaccharide 4'-kinase [Halieaceae bacterium]
MVALDRFALALERAWHRPPRWLWLLYPLELAYAAVTGLRRRLYRRGVLSSGHPGCPVIVIGNINVGGTGKTPAVIAIAEALAARGLRCALVSRGYGGSGRAPRRVTRDAEVREVGDEALLLARSAPCAVYVGRRRLATAQLARHEGAEVILCDDGLQHYGLQRDVEIVTVDAAAGFGNGHLLPVGPLREPRRRLATVDYLLERGGQDPHSALAYVPACFRNINGEEERDVAAPGFGPSVHAIAAIARPQRFFALLRGLGLEPVEHPLRDHETPDAALLASLRDLPLVMTAKDAVKCSGLDHPDAWVLEMKTEFPEGFIDSLLRRAGLGAAA